MIAQSSLLTAETDHSQEVGGLFADTLSLVNTAILPLILNNHNQPTTPESLTHNALMQDDYYMQLVPNLPKWILTRNNDSEPNFLLPGRIVLTLGGNWVVDPEWRRPFYGWDQLPDAIFNPILRIEYWMDNSPRPFTLIYGVKEGEPDEVMNLRQRIRAIQGDSVFYHESAGNRPLIAPYEFRNSSVRR